MKKLTEAQIRKIKTEKLFNRFFLISGILFLGFISWLVYNNYYKYDVCKYLELAKSQNKEVKGQQICMFGNKLNVGPSISVVIDGETYYACCHKCEHKLKINYQNSQFAVDKYSHRRIKKSKAFIVLDKKSKVKVSYFESEENFNHYKYTNSKLGNENQIN